MTWQDELIELETKLASGALSAEEYRRARDELLAQSQSAQSGPSDSARQPATTGRPAAPQSPPEAPAQEEQQPAAPPPSQPQPPAQQSGQQYPAQQGPGGPFPPPFQWGQSGQSGQPGQFGKPGNKGPGSKGDPTQVMRPVGSAAPPANSGSGERTQIVRDDDPDRTQTVSDPDRTQTVSGVGQQSRGPGAGGPRRLDEDEAPPWAGADSTPVIAPSTAWMKQGPESFEVEPAKRGRLVGTVVAGVLALVLAVVAVVYFTATGSSTSDQATPRNQPPAAEANPSSTATSSAPPPLPEPPVQRKEPPSAATALVKPPGKVRAGGGMLKPGELASRQLFAAPIVRALDSAGFTGGMLEPTTDGDVTIGLFALSVRSTADAKSVVDSYGQVQNSGGVPARREESMKGVAVFGNADDETSNDHVRRAIYVLYRRVIIVDVAGPDLDRVRRTFEALLHQQVDTAPPTVRDFP